MRLDEGRFPALELNNRRLSMKNSFCRKNGIYTRSVNVPSVICDDQLAIAIHFPLLANNPLYRNIVKSVVFFPSFLFQLSVSLMILTGINNVVFCVADFPHNSPSLFGEQTEPGGIQLLISASFRSLVDIQRLCEATIYIRGQHNTS